MINRPLSFGALLLTLWIAVPSAVCFGAEYFVDGSVASSGSGTIASPFRTIQEGLNRAAAGDVVTVRGGASGQTYSGSPSLPLSGTATQRITLRAYPGEVVILTGTSGTRLSMNRDYWTFDGLTIDQAGLAADAVKINASHITIQNCEIRNGQREGISIERAADVTIQDCSIRDFMWIASGTRNDAHCIMIDTSISSTINGIVIQRNTIQRCSGDGTQIFGVTGQDIATYAKNISFLSNTFLEGTTTTGQTENALDFKAGDGVLVRGNVMRGYINNKTIVVQKGSRNISIEDNVISNGLSGIEMREEGGSSFIQLNQRIVGNVIHDMSSFALKFDGVKNATVANNTLADIGAEGFRFERTVTSLPSVELGLIQNNLSFNVGSSPVGAGLLSGLTIGPNGWFQSSAGGLAATADRTGSDPGFVDGAGGNYHLTSGSACIDAGVNLGRPYSGAAPDLGAYESSSGVSDTTPPAAVSDMRPR